MRKFARRELVALAAMIGLMLSGCAQQRPPVDPATAVAQLSTGAPLLRCRADCVADWRHAQPYATQLDAAGRWLELAALVITTGYQDDLTLYYLARAAEGLGYSTAAASYYRQSTYISGTSLSCRYGSGVCAGLVLPDAALARIDAIESEASRSRRPPRRHPTTGAKAAVTGSKPLLDTERKPKQSAAPAREPERPDAAESEPPQPAALAPEQKQSTTTERPDTISEPPLPTRVDPIAKQYIEPPAAR